MIKGVAESKSIFSFRSREALDCRVEPMLAALWGGTHHRWVKIGLSRSPASVGLTEREIVYVVSQPGAVPAFDPVPGFVLGGRALISVKGRTVALWSPGAVGQRVPLVEPYTPLALSPGGLLTLRYETDGATVTVPTTLDKQREALAKHIAHRSGVRPGRHLPSAAIRRWALLLKVSVEINSQPSPQISELPCPMLRLHFEAVRAAR